VSTVSNADVVDRIAIHSSGRLTLYIVVPLPWADEPDQSRQLLAKINAYHRWIVSGDCRNQYPAAQVGIDIVVACQDDPSKPAAEVLAAAAQGFKPMGVGVYFDNINHADGMSW